MRPVYYKQSTFCIRCPNIETRDAKREDTSREELLQSGGALKVPCLRIEDEQGQVSWMYESSEIINYLDGRFMASPA